MNEKYLLNKFARHTYTAARKYDPEKKPILSFTADPAFNDDFITGRFIKSDSFPFSENRIPFIFSVGNRLIYSCIPTPDPDSRVFYLLGPTRFTSALPLRYMVYEEPSAQFLDFTETVPFCSVKDFFEDILLLYNLLNDNGPSDRPLDQYDLIMESCTGLNDFDDAMQLLHRKIFASVEESSVHNPYNHEKRQVNAIKDGNIEILSGILREETSARYGTLSQDPVKQAKYIGIVETTLASRAAIQGGVHPETAYNLSDITIQKLDACSDIASIKLICKNMQVEYATMVSKIRTGEHQSHAESENTHISHCKDYVFTHLHGRVTVHEIAGAIGLEENYLSSLFRKHEDKTLTSYIMEEKISLAKNMLIYSDYTFAQISAYLGFSSQSHFGQAFKKITGMTPRRFRDVYADDDFINSSI